MQHYCLVQEVGHAGLETIADRRQQAGAILALRTFSTGRKCFTNLPSGSYFLPKVMGEYTLKYW